MLMIKYQEKNIATIVCDSLLCDQEFSYNEEYVIKQKAIVQLNTIIIKLWMFILASWFEFPSSDFFFKVFIVLRYAIKIF